MNYNYKSNTNGAGCLITLFIIIFIICTTILLCLWTDRTLDFWCSYFKGCIINVPMWLSAILTLVGNAVTLFLNIVSEIARLII